MVQARDVIRAIPIRGEAHRHWENRVARGRLAVLDHHLRNSGLGGRTDATFSDLANRFLAIPEPLRLKVAASPEFGAWIAEIRDAFERGDRVLVEGDAQAIRARLAPFLIYPLLLQDPGATVCIKVSAVDGLVAVPGTPLFFKLGGTGQEAICRIEDGGLTFTAEGTGVIRFARNEVAALLNGDGTAPRSVTGLPVGAYRLPELSLPGMYLGLPVNRMLTASRIRMAQALDAGNAPDTLMTFAVDASRFVDEVNGALLTIAEVWPEMGEALPLHTRFVAPIFSDRVFSYSEMSSPNAVFLRADPRGPLWYVELLVHETCHVWLASLMELIPMIDSDQTRRFPSPWRADPRPLIGILFGAHAFAVVARCLFLLLEHGTPHEDVVARRLAFESERVERGCRLLEQHGSFSKAGEIFMSDLRRVVEEVTAGACRMRYTSVASESTALDPIWPTAA